MHEDRLVNLGIKVIPLNKLRRSSINPITELLAFFELYFLIREERPDILHQVALKPIVMVQQLRCFSKQNLLLMLLVVWGPYSSLKKHFCRDC